MSARTGRPLAQGDVLWEPPADARERFELGRYLEWLRSERGLDFPGYEEALALVDLRSRGVLGVDLGLLRGSLACTLRAGARLARDARRRVVPGSSAELRRAHARPGRGRREVAVVAYSQTREPHGAHVRRPQGAGRARASGTEAPRRRARRPGRRLPAEHPGDARRLPRDRESRCDLGDVPAGVRCPERSPSARAARAEGAPRCRALPLRREARRSSRAGGRDPGGPGEPGDRRPRAVPRGCRRRTPGRRLLGRAPRGERAARVRAVAVLAPAVRALLLRHDRPAEGDRALPRRHPARAPEEPRLQLGPEARRPAPVVHDDRLDDVERARLRAAPACVDRHDRRQPGVSRPLLPVAAHRGDEADLLRAEPRLHDGVSQGGARAGDALRPLLGPHGLRGGLAVAARGVRVALRAVRAGHQRQRRQRRDRRLHGARPGLPAPSRVGGRDVGAHARRRRRTRSGRTGSRSSASSASS